MKTARVYAWIRNTIIYQKEDNGLFQLDLKSRKSIHEQVVDNIKELIISGVLSPDEKLPSIRDISKTLTVNPNTIQKSYKELERQGFIYTLSGLGSFVSSSLDLKIDENRVSKIKYDIGNSISELFFMGLKKDAVTTIVTNIINERSIGNDKSWKCF